MRFAAMAGVAGHFVIPVERVGIHAANHFEHFARDYFLLLVIAGEVALNMTIAAFEACSHNEGAHNRTDFVLRNDFQIFGGAHPAATALAAAWRRSILCKQRDSSNREGC